MDEDSKVAVELVALVSLRRRKVSADINRASDVESELDVSPRRRNTRPGGGGSGRGKLKVEGSGRVGPRRTSEEGWG